MCKPRVRSKAVLKTYVCLFVCFTTKAVHLELVTDLTTDAFLAALRRFTARRGWCTDIYYDNATNFIGANRTLKELYSLFQKSDCQELIHRLCANEGMNWHTIPPNSAHFGGLWEAAVKSSKHHIRRVIGTTMYNRGIEHCNHPSRRLSQFKAIISDVQQSSRPGTIDSRPFFNRRSVEFNRRTKPARRKTKSFVEIAANPTYGSKLLETMVSRISQRATDEREVEKCAT